MLTAAFLGPMLPRQALANSRNTPAIAVLRRIGMDRAFTLLQQLGLHDGRLPASVFGLSLAIGSMPTSLTQLVEAYGALADDGLLRALHWYRGQSAEPAQRVISTDAARLVTLFLADPMARLPSFPRNGSMELPFPVALKTGTSQGYRDAWTVAWSAQWMVAGWIGRPDARPMQSLSGARAAAGLVRAALLELHGSLPGQLEAGSFPLPSGWAPLEACAGKADAAHCARTVADYAPLQTEAAARPAGNRRSLGSNPDDPIQLTIVAPDRNSRLWRNPEMPAGYDVLMLRGQATPSVPQVVWYVDDQPFAVSSLDQPVAWPMTAGEHRIQLRLPYRPEASGVLRISVN